MSSPAAKVFELMAQTVEAEGASLVAKVNATIKFDLQKAGSWLIDLKNGNGQVKPCEHATKADLTITMSEKNFMLLMQNKLNPQRAYMRGILKLRGKMALAMKLGVVVAATRAHMKKQGIDAAAVISSASTPQKPATQPSKAKTTSTTTASSTAANLQVEELFKLMTSAVEQHGSQMAKQLRAVVRFEVSPVGTWTLDLKNAKPSVTKAATPSEPSATNPDVTLRMNAQDFVAIAQGKLQAQQAFMRGKLKVRGNMMLASKLSVVFNALKPTSKM